LLDLADFAQRSTPPFLRGFRMLSALAASTTSPLSRTRRRVSGRFFSGRCAKTRAGFLGGDRDERDFERLPIRGRTGFRIRRSVGHKFMDLVTSAQGNLDSVGKVLYHTLCEW
jgi:hypothetical protein